MRTLIIATLVALPLFFTNCNSDKNNKSEDSYFAFSPEQMDVILTNYASTIKTIGEPQVKESRVVIDSAKGIIIREILTTRNFQFVVPLDEKGELIEDPKQATARKKNDCPGTGTITCRLRCNGTGCTWSGCNAYPCTDGKCSGGCTLLDCTKLASGTGTKKIFIQ
jgi:hypothetical protein